VEDKIMRHQKTIRRLSPTARRFAHLVNDLEVTSKRISKLIDDVSQFERDSDILFKASKRKKLDTQEPIDWHESGIGSIVSMGVGDDAVKK
jgi:hypothetical protein